MKLSSLNYCPHSCCRLHFDSLLEVTEIVIHTWCSNSILIQNIVTPDWFMSTSVDHRTHHLVKCLVGVAL